MVADYLRVRRSLGYKLDHAEYILTRCADYGTPLTPNIERVPRGWHDRSNRRLKQWRESSLLRSSGFQA